MLNPKIQIKKSRLGGKGLFATEKINKSELCWELDKTEKKLTYKQLSKLSREKQKLAFQYKDKYIISTDKGEVMNHSCDPNTWWKGDDQLVASKDIAKGDEITYDYSTADVEPDWVASWQCHCGSKNCRKRISSKDCLNPEFQKRHQGHLPSWVVNFIRRNQKEKLRNHLDNIAIKNTNFNKGKDFEKVAKELEI